MMILHEVRITATGIDGHGFVANGVGEIVGRWNRQRITVTLPTPELIQPSQHLHLVESDVESDVESAAAPNTLLGRTIDYVTQWALSRLTNTRLNENIEDAQGYLLDIITHEATTDQPATHVQELAIKAFRLLGGEL